ncbi:hypothetical protein AAFG22_14700 [Bradyrhizobium sp. B024]|uniref:carph-isopro domain-containing protein n=1 Tax=Bradyrhizobium sp. B024 TaxID=3140247 RepID=UPI00318363C5
MSAVAHAIPENSPAVRIIKRFGGLTKAARAWNKSKSTVQRWQQSGYIHPDYYNDILAAAVAERVRLDPNDFNVVDVSHPAFSAPSTASPDSTVARAAGSSPRPTLETELSPLADQCPWAGAREISRGVSSSSEHPSIEPEKSGAE